MFIVQMWIDYDKNIVYITHHSRSIPDLTYHTSKVELLPWEQLDPSIAIAFYCKTESSFDSLCQQFDEVNSSLLYY